MDELLSRDNNDFDEDGALSLLQERLQIKPIDLSNLSIPEFQGVGKTDFKALGERLPKGRKSVSNMSNLVKQLSGQTPRQFKDAAENLTTASPTPPRSPFPSLSLLKMRSLQSNQLRDPFSPLNVDLVEHEHPPGEDIDEQSNKLDGLKELSMSGKSRSEMEDKTRRPSGSGMEIHTLESRGSDSLIDDSVDKRLDGQIRDTDTRPHESQTDLPDEMNRETMDCDTPRTIETNVLTKDPEQLEENVSLSEITNYHDFVKMGDLHNDFFKNFFCKCRLEIHSELLYHPEKHILMLMTQQSLVAPWMLMYMTPVR